MMSIYIYKVSNLDTLLNGNADDQNSSLEDIHMNDDYLRQ